jgi:hypothetical protein
VVAGVVSSQGPCTGKAGGLRYAGHCPQRHGDGVVAAKVNQAQTSGRSSSAASRSAQRASDSPGRRAGSVPVIYGVTKAEYSPTDSVDRPSHVLIMTRGRPALEGRRVGRPATRRETHGGDHGGCWAAQHLRCSGRDLGDGRSSKPARLGQNPGHRAVAGPRCALSDLGSEMGTEISTSTAPAPNSAPPTAPSSPPCSTATSTNYVPTLTTK